MDPIAIRELMPDFLAQGCPVDTVVTEDAAWYLTENQKDHRPDHSAASQEQGQVHRQP